MTNPAGDTDHLLSIACDAVGTFDENAFNVEYAQEDSGVPVVEEEYQAEQFSNNHYLG